MHGFDDDGRAIRARTRARGRGPAIQPRDAGAYERSDRARTRVARPAHGMGPEPGSERAPLLLDLRRRTRGHAARARGAGGDRLVLVGRCVPGEEAEGFQIVVTGPLDETRRFSGSSPRREAQGRGSCGRGLP